MHPILNIHFFLVCLSSVLFSASYNMLIPELPSYLSSLGGAEHKGLIVALFTLTAGLSRPFSGKLTDTLGRIPVMAVGSIVCFVCGFLYPILGTVSGFLFLRLFHGFSTGFKPTATAAYVADVIPKERWGEALGIHGMSFSLGLMIGPAIGSTIRLYYSVNVLFYVSSLLALLSILILINMKETLKVKQSFKLSSLKISKEDLFAFEVLPAAFVTFLAYLGYGVILTLIPDWSQHVGVVNKGLFFVVLTISSLVTRLLSGKVSDRFGRVRVVNAGLMLLILSLLSLGHADRFSFLMVGAALYGLATGILAPALNAWTVDMSHPNHRGRGMATMYIALEAGIGVGAFLSGWFYQDVITQVPLIIDVSAFMAFVGLVYMILRKPPAKNSFKHNEVSS